MPSSSSLFSYYSLAAHPDLPSFPTRRSSDLQKNIDARTSGGRIDAPPIVIGRIDRGSTSRPIARPWKVRSTAVEPRSRSEEHTSELQSRFDLVCRLLLEKKKNKKKNHKISKH